MYKKLLFITSLLLGTVSIQDSVVHAQQRDQEQQVLSQQTNPREVEEPKDNNSISPPIIELTAPIQDDSVAVLLSELAYLRRLYLETNQAFDKVILIINSSGGNMQAGQTAYEHLKNLPFTLHTHNIAESSSVASTMYCAGDIRTTSPNAYFMLHYSTIGGASMYGDSQSLATHERMKNYSRFFERVTSNCTNLSEEEVKNTLQKGTVYDVDEASEVSLIQEVSYPSEAMNNTCYHSVIFYQAGRVSLRNIVNCFKTN